MADDDRSSTSRGRALDINLNLNVRGLKQSATLEINERSRELERQGRTVCKLGLGQSPFPVPEPVVQALRDNAHQKDYLPVKGLPELRDVVARYHRRTKDIERTADDVLVGPGSKELMFLAQLTYYGDLVIPTPSWVSYAPQAQIIGRNIRWMPTQPENQWRLMPEELDRLCHDDPSRPRLLILNYPSNPTGDTYSTRELRDLARVARRYEVLLLSDEIYSGLHYDGKHDSIARYYPEGTIISGGLSKWCGAGGWRLGTFTFPAELHWLLDAMAVAASETFTSTSAPIQYAAIRAFQGGEEIERYLATSRRILQALGEHLWERLASAGISVTRPLGGFYLFPDFSPHREMLEQRGIRSGRQLCDRMLEETGVAILPGEMFGRPRGELTARLAFVDFDGEAALNAAYDLPDGAPIDTAFLERYCQRVVDGIDRVCEWLN